MLAFLKGLIDLRDPTENVDQKLALKADKAVTDKHVKTVSFDGKTGVFTFISEDGTSQTLDTMLEKVPVRCYLDGQTFVLVLEDGTEQRADLSAFLTETEFVDSETIDFAISDGSVRASVKAGSITLDMLESTVVSNLQGYMTAAQTAAENAKPMQRRTGMRRRHRRRQQRKVRVKAADKLLQRRAGLWAERRRVREKILITQSIMRKNQEKTPAQRRDGLTRQWCTRMQQKAARSGRNRQRRMRKRLLAGILYLTVKRVFPMAWHR